MDAKELVMTSLVIEGHRDVYEQLYRTSVGEKSPIRDGVAPRLIRDGINMGGPWKDGAVLSAKTGTYPQAEGDITWLVGHVATSRGGRYVFVSAVQAPPGKQLSPPPALASAIEALKAHGLL